MRLIDSIASLAKIALLSKWRVPMPKADEGDEIVILGNGPSLRGFLDRHSDFLIGKSCLAVNFFAATDDFTSVKPKYYLLADPLFFADKPHENVARLWEAINNVDWQMSLLVPAKAPLRGLNNGHITIHRFNMTPVEGYAWLENWAYSTGLGTPRPRNVLIPSIMAALRMGYQHIYIAGADHSWTRTLWVDDANHVVSVQPHFYEDNESEKSRIAADYLHYPLHSIIYSFYVAFRSYHVIRRYADSIGRQIINITPDSFIDAFDRRRL